MIGRDCGTREDHGAHNVAAMDILSDSLNSGPAAHASPALVIDSDDGWAESVMLSEGKYGPYQVVARAASSTLIVDEPMGVGGLGSGPTPFDLLSAALGSCALMTMRRYATERAWPLERLVVRVVHDRPALAARDRFLKEIQITGRLTSAQVAALIEVSMRCPIHLTLARGSQVETRLVGEAGIAQVAIGRTAHMRAMREACGQGGMPGGAARAPSPPRESVSPPPW